MQSAFSQYFNAVYKATEAMEAKSLNRIIGKLLDLTKQIYLKKPLDGSGLVRRFLAGKNLGNPFLSSSFGLEWWITRRGLECCGDIADMAISSGPQLQGGDRDTFLKSIEKTLQENANNPKIFKFDSLFLGKANNLFESRAIESPREFACYLWNEIHISLADSIVEWLTLYPLRLVKAESFILKFDGLSIFMSSDQERWKQLSDKYDDSKYWNPGTGTWEEGVDRFSFKDFLLVPTWLVCEASGTSSGSRNLSGDYMRTFIAILCSYLNSRIPNLLTKSGADIASCSIQFPNDSVKAQCGYIREGIGNLFPPLLVDKSLNISSELLSEIQNWYGLRDGTSTLAAQRATTASHFLHYGIIHNGLERFIYFFIALDALFGERDKVEKNIKEGIRKTFPGEANWENRADELFKLRNELVHGGISSIRSWDRLDHYRRCFKSHPMRDIQTAAMSALRVYFTNQVFDHLFKSSTVANIG